MRSAEEMRQRLIDRARSFVLRPSMHARGGRQADDIARGILQDLCFLDERDDDYPSEILDGYGRLGVSGPFEAMFGHDVDCLAEVVSVHAQLLSAQEYLPITEPLDDARWTALTSGLAILLDDRDVRRSEVEAVFGPAGLVVGDRVLCYASVHADEPWVFVDCWSETTTTYNSGKGTYSTARDSDPLVRLARSSAGAFDDGLVMTRYGRVLRWGPGWWIDHPAPGASEESRAIAGQLRQVRAEDPSRSS